MALSVYSSLKSDMLEFYESFNTLLSKFVNVTRLIVLYNIKEAKCLSCLRMLINAKLYPCVFYKLKHVV